MGNCFVCEKKFGMIETMGKGKDLKKLQETLPYEDETINQMSDKDALCVTCLHNLTLTHALDSYNHSKEILSEEDFQKMVNDPQNQELIEEAHRQLAEKEEIKQDEKIMHTIIDETPKIESPTIQQRSVNLSKSLSAAQLHMLTKTLHDQTKAQWDKNGIVQFKNDRIAILKRVVGQQVQFIVAYDQVTAEGYRLMAIDEGMTTQGSGFSGGLTAFFYFQKMDYVR
jgi:hypothetical protein